MQNIIERISEYMGIRTSTAVKKPEVKIEEKLPLNPPVLLATMKKTIGLKFSNGYEFSICMEGEKLIFSATVNGHEAFYLDEIPEEFVEALRRMLA